MKKVFAVIIISALIASMFVFSVNAQSYQFVGSKGSDVYHYPTCTYAKNIKTENLVKFIDAEDAINKGYHACSVCKPPTPVSSTTTPSPSPTAKPSSSPTPKPTAIQTATPTTSPTAGPTSTITPTPTQSPTNMLSPTPVTPEITPLALVVGLLAVSSVVLVSRKRQLGKQSDGKGL
jgi:hypothetical protein